MTTSSVKGLRISLQILSLGVAAWLVLDGKITAGAMFAASIIGARALGPIDQVVSAWRSLQAARLSWANLAELVREHDSHHHRAHRAAAAHRRAEARERRGDERRQDHGPDPGGQLRDSRRRLHRRGRAVGLGQDDAGARHRRRRADCRGRRPHRRRRRPPVGAREARQAHRLPAAVGAPDAGHGRRADPPLRPARRRGRGRGRQARRRPRHDHQAAARATIPRSATPAASSPAASARASAWPGRSTATPRS